METDRRRGAGDARPGCARGGVAGARWKPNAGGAVVTPGDDRRATARGRRRAHAPALALLLACALHAGVANAYVRATTPSGIPYHWNESCVFMTPSTARSPDLTPDDIAGVVWSAALTWSRSVNPCTYLDLSVAPASEAAGRVRADGVNSVIMRQDRWCPDTEGGTPAPCYDAGALALTSFFANNTDGRIFDADIEVNGVNFQWARLDESRDPADANANDLQNTLTHEMGHVIGLDHNCWAPGAEHRNDDHGVPAVPCDGAPPDIRAATMFYSATRGDISKRTLAPDDVAGVCGSYPIAQDPHLCQPAALPRAGCSFVPRGSSRDCDPPVALLLAVAVGSIRTSRGRPSVRTAERSH